MTTSNAAPTISRRTVFAGLGAAGIGLAFASRTGRASAQEATPATATSAAGPLLSAVLDAGLFAVPSGALVLARLVDEPGFSQAIAFATNGPAISHVVAGTYTLRSEGPIVLLRPSPDGAAVAESIPAGQEATAQAGETLLHLSGARTEESNQGDVPNERYSFVVAGPDQPTIEDQQGTSNGELLAYIDPGLWTVPASGPVTVTLAREDAATPAAAATPVAGQQVVGELAGPPAQRVMVTLSPGELPGATPVNLATE